MTHGPTADDRLQIFELYARYAWSLDTYDIDAFVACFTPDGTIDMPGLGRFAGAVRLRDYAHQLLDDPRYRGRQHWVSQVLFDGDGDELRVRCYGIVTYRSPESGEISILSTGYYADRIVRPGGVWQIAERSWNRWEGPILQRFPQP